MSDLESNAAPEPAVPAGSRPSNALLAIVLVVILVILGGGGWLVYDKVIKSDDSTSSNAPASVLPASTVAVAMVNSSPSVSQKLNLLTFIGKFPSLKSKVTVGPKDDPRKWVVDQILNSEKCPSISFDKDFTPWLGTHFALGAVDVGAGKVAPVAALQASDGSAAKSAIGKVVACTKSTDFIYTVTNGYLIASDSQAHLDTIVGDAKTKPLSDDAGYTKWTGKIGTDGILNFYVASKGLSDLVAQFSDQLSVRTGGLKTALGDFTGLAGSLTAANDGLELKMAVGSKTLTSSAGALGSEVAALPSDTTLAFGLGMSPTMADQLSKSIVEALTEGLPTKGGSPRTPAEAKALIKQYTGLTLPGDITNLLGKAVVLSLGGNAPDDLSTIQNPLQLPLGLKINGDPAKIKAVIAKLEAKAGGTLAQMGFVSRVAGSDYVLATNQSYANAITGSGALGNDPEFLDAVPQASKAQSLLFLRIDSSWRTAIINLLKNMDDATASQIADNTAGLSALGIASWTDGDAGMVDVKLTTK